MASAMGLQARWQREAETVAHRAASARARQRRPVRRVGGEEAGARLEERTAAPPQRVSRCAPPARELLELLYCEFEHRPRRG